MAHFYASIQGSRGEASRMGTTKSGIEGHIRGWNVGCNVDCYVDSDGKDCVSITLTGGSSGSRSGMHLGTFTADDLKV